MGIILIVQSPTKYLQCKEHAQHDVQPITGIQPRPAGNIFMNSGCAFQDDPTEEDKGPFCASSC